MTKKDYIAIANVIKDCKQFVKDNTPNDDIILGINMVMNSLLPMFRQDNHNFDTTKFIDYVNSDKRYKDFTDK